MFGHSLPFLDCCCCSTTEGMIPIKAEPLAGDTSSSSANVERSKAELLDVSTLPPPPKKGGRIVKTPPAADDRRCTHCGLQKTPQWRMGPLGPKTLCNACGVGYKTGRLVAEYRPAASPTFVSHLHSNKHRKVLEMRRNKEPQHLATAAADDRRCTHCGLQKTPQWRMGPLGPKTLCNACGVRYKTGRLVAEYRPAASPTFVSHLHSNKHRKVLEMRRNKEQQHLAAAAPTVASGSFQSVDPTKGLI